MEWGGAGIIRWGTTYIRFFLYHKGKDGKAFRAEHPQELDGEMGRQNTGNV
ncbi:hypothetical protein GCM10027299_28170 [Larkinella ripae]